MPGAGPSTDSMRADLAETRLEVHALRTQLSDSQAKLEVVECQLAAGGECTGKDEAVRHAFETQQGLRATIKNLEGQVNGQGWHCALGGWADGFNNGTVIRLSCGAQRAALVDLQPRAVLNRLGSQSAWLTLKLPSTGVCWSVFSCLLCQSRRLRAAS